MHDVLWTTDIVDHLLETLGKCNEYLVIIINEVMEERQQLFTRAIGANGNGNGLNIAN